MAGVCFFKSVFTFQFSPFTYSGYAASDSPLGRPITDSPLGRPITFPLSPKKNKFITCVYANFFVPLRV